LSARSASVLSRFSSIRHLRTSSYQLVPARTSWPALFTHMINAFGHSAGTYQEIPGIGKN
ncbi:hypothetical protein BE221DRAFT_163537, partial [Ostreococcus tauri]